MISEDSLKEMSHIFCGDIEGYYSYKRGIDLVAFLIVIIKQAMYINKVSPLVGHMYMIKLCPC